MPPILPEQSLKEFFNFSAFRPGQKEIVESILSGQDVIALMPTGGGKSLCYQLPALIGSGLTIIISPLIALMKDQVDSLRARKIGAAYINSSLRPDEVAANIQAIISGTVKILYLAPERLQHPQLKQIYAACRVGLVAIDEAHCVSQWGHDFRPDYLLIKNFIDQFTERPVVAAFTATATPEVKDEIIARLELRAPQIFIRGFDRPNLKFFVQNGLNKKTRMQEALRIIRATPGSGIVYAMSRKGAEEMASWLRQHNVSATSYHAGLDSIKRARVQNDFMENKFDVIVATVAFGMGVDKADVRFVIHAGMPSSIESYYQEAGRAGRDGGTAYCVLLASKGDVGLHYHFIQKGKQEMQAQGKSHEEIAKVGSLRFDRLTRMKQYAELSQCRRKTILEYFADPDAAQYADKKCAGCDVCLDYKWNNSAVPVEKQKKTTARKTNVGAAISATVDETVRLYQTGYSLERIAKARTIAVGTVVGHLIEWYHAGGELKIEELVTPNEEKMILRAMVDADDYQKLRSIKDKLPESVSYEKIHLLLAKIQKMKL